MNESRLKSTRLLVLGAFLFVSAERAFAQDETGDQLAAVVSAIAEMQARVTSDDRALLIATDRVLVRVDELRFENRESTWTDREKAAMVVAVVAAEVRTRPCSGDCELGTDERRLTLGRPEPIGEDTVLVLAGIHDRSDRSSGWTVRELRVERTVNGWTATESRFLFVRDAVACDPDRSC